MQSFAIVGSPHHAGDEVTVNCSIRNAGSAKTTSGLGSIRLLIPPDTIRALAFISIPELPPNGITPLTPVNFILPTTLASGSYDLAIFINDQVAGPEGGINSWALPFPRCL